MLAQGLAFFQSMGLAHGDLKHLCRNLLEISFWSQFVEGKLGNVGEMLRIEDI